MRIRDKRMITTRLELNAMGRRLNALCEALTRAATATVSTAPTSMPTPAPIATRVARVVPAAFTPSWRIKPSVALWAHKEYVYIRWSVKLGLKLQCKDHAQATRLRDAIRIKGIIRPDLWTKCFNPTNQWGH